MYQSRQILTVDDFRTCVEGFTAPPGFDYETNGQEVFHHASRIVGVSLAAPYRHTGKVEAFYIPVAHQTGTNCDPAIQTPLAEYLDANPVVPFHLNTEYQWTLHKLKVRLKVAGDGYYAARLLQLEDKNLKDLAKNVLGREEVIKLADLLPKGVWDFSILDAQDPRANQYVQDDGINAYELEVALRSIIAGLGMQGVYELEMLAGAAMAEQELAGYLLKPNVLVQMLAREKVRIEKLASNIFRELGVAPFTVNSYVQLGKALKAKGYTSPLTTETGAESWSVDALRLLPQTPLITDIIDWKKTFSVVNGLGRAPLEPAEDGRLHPHWLSMGYSGHPRMQSERPSLTNLPKAARVAFPAPPGYRWFMATWLQPEIRVLAMGSGDRNMADLLNLKFDFYTTVGATMAGRLAGEGTSDDRDMAKKLIYAYLDYCGDPEMVAKRMNVPESVARELLDSLYRLFPELANFALTVKLNANAEPGTKRFVTSYMNRRWFIEPDERDRYEGPAMRAYVQHSVATYLKIAMTRLMGHAEVRHPALRGFHSLIPVYDTLFYCLDETVPVVQHLSYMASIFEQPFHHVTMRAEYGVGPTWGETPIITEQAFAQAMADFTAQQPPPGWHGDQSRNPWEWEPEGDK